MIIAVISDKGIGFDVNLRKSKGGLGLISIEERVREARGTVSITSQPGEGTSIELRIPIAPEPASAE